METAEDGSFFLPRRLHLYTLNLYWDALEDL